ncbi:MAG TPA: glycoside hydrolase family 9 protein [Verrucomicrobiota bacterium]|nr:glycoside hydrolase family 9 protein [Verrucomicrobiota bacterium]
MFRFRSAMLSAMPSACLVLATRSAAGGADADPPLATPRIGEHALHILTPEWIELTLVTTKETKASPADAWNFVEEGRVRLPTAGQIEVLVDGSNVPVSAVGFRRRVLYAPLKERDLRIGNSLFLRLSKPPGTRQQIEVRNPDGRLWSDRIRFAARMTDDRWSPVIHVSHIGYLPGRAKKGMVGYYLGSAGELELPETADREFALEDVITRKEVFRGKLEPRPDRGFPFTAYQHVLEADFTEFNAPGFYRLKVPGLGASRAFEVGDGVAGILARTYALGLYHQRCGAANEFPFTRFTHGPCHLTPAEIPSLSARFENVNHVLELETSDAKENARHKAPAMKDVRSCLFPFAQRGPVDVRGGHHDAGDYSKYTANSATLIHLLVFAADNFPGAGDLDNLGIPESGDGKSDILQEAKWEADFLAKMQDADGGFYFLVYPRERRYENDVLPDEGDPQVVFPKTTAATAAAVAALAQCASSPRFREQFPEAAALYLEKAKRGWAFLERALAKHGKDGAYQKITHYGNDFIHDDELAWAACEMFLATGDEFCAKAVSDWLKPADPASRKWGWWRLFEAYGHAARSYAFAARSGRVDGSRLQPDLLEQCEAEIVAAARDQLQRARDCAYGTSFPIETKRTRTAGWYFGTDAAFDLAVACQLEYPPMNDPRPAMLDALLSNLNFETGCNPVNVSYLTGVGWKRQHEVVHQYAQNDRRVLPPSGIPLGSIHDGFHWMEQYGEELGALTFPADDDPGAPYPFYDRWGDSYNLKQEFVISNQGRGLAVSAWLMAETGLKTQRWRSAAAVISGVPVVAQRNRPLKLELSADGMDLSTAEIVWEARDAQPAFGRTFTLTPFRPGVHWVEAEALLPDGRRVFSATNVVVR